MEVPARKGNLVGRVEASGFSDPWLFPSRKGGEDVTDRERKSMFRAALLLAGAAVIRFVVVAPGAAEPPLEDRPSITDSLLAAGDSVVDAKERRSRPFGAGETIDPNVAGEEELDRLPGVGASKALRIVQDREENGPFARVEELARVPGLGPRSVEKLRPYLRIRSPAGTAPARESVPSGTAPRARVAAAGSPVKSGAAGARINLNRATAEELQALPGIGAVMAERIVAFRAEHGSFGKPEELMEVSGVGARTFARIAPLVTTR